MGPSCRGGSAMMAIGDIVAAVRGVVGEGPIALHSPTIGRAEAESVARCIGDNVVGYAAVDRFQATVARVCGVDQALAVSSGTAALHLALLVIGVQPGDEVLVPGLTFVATANAACYCGAVPNFVDVRAWDYGINTFKLGRYLERIAKMRGLEVFNIKTGRRIGALIAVDLLGVPADMDEINAIAAQWEIPVIEDAAEALGSLYKGRPCGSNARVGCLSFNSNKIITTNGGGALLTNDPFLQAKAWELATTARKMHPWRMGDHSCVAYNYRMGNINAALGQPQLDRLEKLVEYKTKLHGAYAKVLKVELEGQHDPLTRCNHWLNVLRLDPLDKRRDEICVAMIADGIACRTLFTPLHLLPMFEKNPRDNLAGAEEIWHSSVCLPSSPSLGENL
jgi:perosamine synthetase